MNRNFVNAAHHDGKKVYAWTANDEDVMTRMIFMASMASLPINSVY